MAVATFAFVAKYFKKVRGVNHRATTPLILNRRFDLAILQNEFAILDLFALLGLNALRD